MTRLRHWLHHPTNAHIVLDALDTLAELTTTFAAAHHDIDTTWLRHAAHTLTTFARLHLQHTNRSQNQ